MKKKIDNYNIYKIDNYLIKIGYVLLLIIISIFLKSIFPNLNNIPASDSIFKFFLLAFLFSGSIVMLFFGYYFRRKENMINAILRQLDTAIELSSNELLENTGYSKLQLEDAILTINKNGLGYYVWDKNSGIISDGRLRRRVIYIDNCPNCGHRLEKNIPITMDKIPSCPSCGTAINVNYINEIKFKEIQNIENEKKEYTSQIKGDKISIGFVIFLSIFFWPAAVIYIILKTRHKEKYSIM